MSYLEKDTLIACIKEPCFYNYKRIMCDSGNAYNADIRVADAGADIFNRGLCLSSGIGMKEGEQDKVIELVR